MPGKKHRKPAVSVCLRILLEAVVGFPSRFMLVLAALVVFAPVSQSATIVFTNDLVISSGDTNYDGLEIIVTNCTVTVDGTHAFAYREYVKKNSYRHKCPCNEYIWRTDNIST